MTNHISCTTRANLLQVWVKRRGPVFRGFIYITLFEPKTIKIVWVSADQSWYNVVNSDESGEIKISTNEINDMDSIADPTKLVCGLASCLYESHRAYHNSKTWSEKLEMHSSQYYGSYNWDNVSGNNYK